MAGDAVEERRGLVELLKEDLDAKEVEALSRVLDEIIKRDEAAREVSRFGCDRCGLLWEEVEPWGIARLKVFRGCCPRCRRQGRER